MLHRHYKGIASEAEAAAFRNIRTGKRDRHGWRGITRRRENHAPQSPMILSFSCADTAQLYRTVKNRRFSAIARVAMRKLINQAITLHDMAVPPGNRLEALNSDWSGFHSIRINDQWRVVFRWTDAGPEDVAIADYH